MNEMQLLEALRIVGRYEVDSLGNGVFVLTPLEHGEIMTTKESDRECRYLASLRSSDTDL